MRFTEEEMNIMKVLKENIGVEYLARDKEFGLHGYIGKPHKVGNIWDNDHGWRIGVRGIESVKWEDDEPVCLKDLFPDSTPNKIPDFLGGNGDMQTMMKNLKQIFRYDKEKTGFLKNVSITVKYTNDFSAISEIYLNGGYGYFMVINERGILWNPNSRNGSTLVVDISELNEFR